MGLKTGGSANAVYYEHSEMRVHNFRLVFENAAPRHMSISPGNFEKQIVLNVNKDFRRIVEFLSTSEKFLF